MTLHFQKKIPFSLAHFPRHTKNNPTENIFNVMSTLTPEFGKQKAVCLGNCPISNGMIESLGETGKINNKIVYMVAA